MFLLVFFIPCGTGVCRKSFPTKPNCNKFHKNLWIEKNIKFCTWEMVFYAETNTFSVERNFTFCLISFLMVPRQVLLTDLFSFLHMQYINLKKSAKTFSVAFPQAGVIIVFLLGVKYSKHTFEMYVETLLLNMQTRTLLRTVWEQPVASSIWINYLLVYFYF